MSLHRTWVWRLQLLIVALAPLALLWLLASLVRCTLSGRLEIAILLRGWIGFAGGLICFPFVAGKTLTQLRFRFVIDAHGLEMRTPSVVACPRWDEIESIILDDLRLLVVPAANYQANPYPGLCLPASTTSDGRRGKEVLGLNQVRESPQQIAEALALHAGSKFVDRRTDDEVCSSPASQPPCPGPATGAILPHVPVG